MSTPQTSRFDVHVARPGQVPAALELLFAPLEPAARESSINAALAEQQHDPHALDGLWVASHEDCVHAALLLKRQPGHTALIYPPQLADPAQTHLADRLLDTVESKLVPESCRLIQALIQPETLAAVPHLRRAGYEHLTDLDYLICHLRELPSPSPSPVQFESFQHDQQSRLERLIRRTYDDTQDCPQLNDVRPMSDVVAGHRASGDFDPANWFFVRRDSQDVGCLLLAEYAGASSWELVYMGIIPDARGAGLGLHVVHHALRHAAVCGARNLVLAMDARNEPARAMYGRAGFVDWQSRTVYWKRLHAP